MATASVVGVSVPDMLADATARPAGRDDTGGPGGARSVIERGPQRQKAEVVHLPKKPGVNSHCWPASAVQGIAMYLYIGTVASELYTANVNAT